VAGTETPHNLSFVTDEAEMKTNVIRAIAALALIAPLGMVQAQDVQLASHAEMNNLYARLAELESRIAAGNVGCADAVGGCGSGCGDCCDDCCGCPGWVGGVEIVWLKAFSSGNDFGDFNYEDGFRGWFGYQGAGGLGARLRYFDYQQTAANGDFVDIEAFDAEVYDTFQVGCNWDLLLGGGIRYLETEVLGNAADLHAIHGVGPVVTAELYRHISDRAALYVIGRQSIVAGDGIFNNALTTDLTTAATEFQLGGQLHRETNGGLVFARLGWESQYFYDLQDGEEGVTLMGLAASIGLMR
jgi:hypothetical protein